MINKSLSQKMISGSSTKQATKIFHKDIVTSSLMTSWDGIKKDEDFKFDLKIIFRNLYLCILSFFIWRSNRKLIQVQLHIIQKP